MGKRKVENEAVSLNTPQEVTEGSNEGKTTKYVVIRDGYRVSDREYDDTNDPSCVAELQFWKKVAKNHSYNEPVEVVVYDSKKHRVW